MAAPCSTLFVRNLPYSTTNDKLEETFSEIGPLKRCFVVKNKGAAECRGFGYVTFALKDDAEKAKTSTVRMEGRKLLIDFANKEYKTKKRKEAEDINIIDTPKTTEEEKKTSSTKDDKKTSYTNLTRTVVITKLPEDVDKEDIEKLLKRTEHVEEIQFPVVEGNETSVHVVYERCKDAKAAIGRLHRKKIKSKKVNADLLARKRKSFKNMKNSRLIVRNLSFKCSEADLQSVFGVHGDISEVSIPKMTNGKMFGYAFVQYTNVIDAAKAVKNLNMNKIKGRPVAVDWAVPKQKYEAAVKEEEISKSTTVEKTVEKTEEIEETLGGESNEDEQTDEESEKSEDSHSNDEEGTSDDESEDDSDSDDDEEEEKERSRVNKPSDVSEGKTVFIRNIPFDLEEEDLADTFTEYGQLVYCKLLTDPDTERSRGCAFIKFRKSEDAEDCLKKASEGDKAAGITIKGRKLFVTMAVSRDDADKLKKDKKDKKETKQTKDKRNLHLAREGLIRPGTKAAEDLSNSDLLKRRKLEAQKRQKLQNLNIFISPTRLSVHNLPKSVDDKKLRELFRKVVDEKGVKITEARVMRDMSAVTTTGTPKSLGYAFVTFTQHEHALKALREVNNNSELFGKEKRPIVEFSLENKLALLAKERRLQKSIINQKLPQEEKSKAIKDLKSKSNQSVTKKTDSEQKQKIKKGLPSHFGPKKRWRNKGKQTTAKKPKDKLSRAKKIQKEPPAQIIPQVPVVKTLKPKKLKRKRSGRSDKFDTLVHQYQNKKAKITKPTKKVKKKSFKWFE
ncbi:RNA-binding protein 28-like [Glandiceps talaboti]